MVEEMNKCASCEDEFAWNDTVVIVDDKLYHKDCVELYPTGYIAMLDGEPLGETENDDGQMAYEIIDGLLTNDEEKRVCFDCQHHVQNDDTGMFECQGQDEICHEFIEKIQSK